MIIWVRFSFKETVKYKQHWRVLALQKELTSRTQIGFYALVFSCFYAGQNTAACLGIDHLIDDRNPKAKAPNSLAFGYLRPFLEVQYFTGKALIAVHHFSTHGPAAAEPAPGFSSLICSDIRYCVSIFMHLIRTDHVPPDNRIMTGTAGFLVLVAKQLLALIQSLEMGITPDTFGPHLRLDGPIDFEYLFI